MRKGSAVGPDTRSCWPRFRRIGPKTKLTKSPWSRCILQAEGVAVEGYKALEVVGPNGDAYYGIDHSCSSV